MVTLLLVDVEPSLVWLPLCTWYAFVPCLPQIIGNITLRPQGVEGRTTLRLPVVEGTLRPPCIEGINLRRIAIEGVGPVIMA